VRQREFAQGRPARRCEPDPHLAFVYRPRASRDGARRLEPVHEFHGAVVLDEQPGCNFADSWPDAFRQAPDCQQELVLMRLDAVLFRRGLAEMNKLTDLPPEFGQIPVLIVEKISAHNLYRITT